MIALLHTAYGKMEDRPWTHNDITSENILAKKHSNTTVITTQTSVNLSNNQPAHQRPLH